MRLPSAVQGMLFAPVLICLIFVLKAFCPESAGESCFADQFAVPIFLPLVAIYKIFGDSSVIANQELLFIVLYWAFVGFLIGFMVDLLFADRRRAASTGPARHFAAAAAGPIIIEKPSPAPKPAPAPAPSIPIIKVPSPMPPTHPVSKPAMASMPAAPADSPGLKLPPTPPASSLITPEIKPAAPVKKPPLNLLDRPEYR